MRVRGDILGEYMPALDETGVGRGEEMTMSMCPAHEPQLGTQEIDKVGGR